MHKSWRHDIVVIGGSTGAMEGLRKLLELLPAGFPATLFVTLHIPSDFPSIIPELLAKSRRWTVRHPQNHEQFKPGEVFVAPPDHHLIIDPSEIVLSRGPRENRHRPAIDVMFRSAARSYGPRVAAVLLSGQLDDGSSGLMAVKMRGGMAIVQDPNEAAVPEMPSRAIQYASPDYVLSLEKIAELLTSVGDEKLPLPKALEAAVPNDKIDKETTEANLEETPKGDVPGTPSVFACPDCHGVLWELEEGKLLRFRCRVGHAYTADSLRLALSESVEDALWVAMRTLEERSAILRRLARRSPGRMGSQYEEDAKGFDRHALVIRKMLSENQQITSKETQASQQGGKSA